MDKYKFFDLPEFSAVKEVLENERDKYVITVFGLCKILYSGRASSIATYSSRLITFKPDGSVLVHSNRKLKPVNWQPSSSDVHVEIGDELRIFVERRRPKEVLEIAMPVVYYLSLAEVDEGEFHLFGSESEMVEEVIRNPELILKDFIPLEREYQTPFGKIDLLGVTSSGYLVLEFKRAQAGLEAVSQLKRYVDYLSWSGNRVRGGIVSPSISKSALKLLKKYGLEHFQLSPKLLPTIRLK
ncbi:endonuclease NucS [Acidianus sp. HS-5]|uniref:endonuclease NucS n=1 Tax=Acidianus sp. HS-5 TaxID=2886040 RepID=UPI001F33CDC7|nr:endonuclease NucS [Acidianus sp. HS-5]BDC17880.1 endonuclease NucS [Acidianus sp. HS-5]